MRDEGENIEDNLVTGLDLLASNNYFLTNIECCNKRSLHKESKESGVLDHDDVNLSPMIPLMSI